MPNWVFQAAVNVVAAAIVLVLLSGFFSAISGRVRGFIFGKVGGAIYRAVTEDSRRAELAQIVKARNIAELHKALDDLGQAIFQGQGAFAEDAAARVRRYCPETKSALNSLLAPLRPGGPPNQPPQLFQARLADVHESAAKCLEL